MSWTLVTLELVAGLTAGALSPDGDLGNYRWDVRPRATLGAHAGVVHGALGVSLHAWTSSTTQETGFDDTEAPTVRLTTVEVVTERRIVSIAGVSLSTGVSVGRVHLGYDPDEMTFDVDGTAVRVGFDPIDEWVLGSSVALRRPVTQRLVAGVLVDFRSFSLDTAHRNGDVIETSRERFDNWSGRIELGYRFGLN